MKKNQIILIGILSIILFLFLMLVYKSDKDHAFSGESKISIYVENGINLPNSDSLRYLINVYSAKGSISPQVYTQTSLDIYADGTPKNISSRPTGFAKFRNFFSRNFYIYEDRVSDINETHTNVSEYSSILKSTSSLTTPIIADIIIEVVDGTPNLSFKGLKDSITSLLSGQKRNLTIAISNGSGISGGEDEGEDQDEGEDEEKGKEKGKGKGKGKTKGTDVPTVIIIDDGGEDEGEDEPTGGSGGCDKKSVKASEITFEGGLPNVFKWVENDGMTYDFTLTCAEGNCSENPLSFSESDVRGGEVKVPASYEETSEKKYKATLTIKCKGKILKTITKTVKLRCA